VIDMNAEFVVAFMILMFLAAYAAAENFARREHARAHRHQVRGERPDLRITGYPSSSGPYR
jgi:hypothetical protein